MCPTGRAACSAGGHFVTFVPVGVGLISGGLALLGAMMIPTSGRSFADDGCVTGIEVTK